ncbi:MAG TPA: hypothetical protein VMW12_12090 [Candidatus Dormibacteraeota bacterium]|nr:hypothetical protein [Candidatus Dormibacteraeota bacterium]
MPTASASAVPTASPTPPPLQVQPLSAQVAVGATQQVTVGGAIGDITAVARNAATVGVTIDQESRTLTLAGEAPGATFVDIADSRGVSYALGVRVAYIAGTIAPYVSIQLTGDPASADYVRKRVMAAVIQAAQLRPNAQVVLSRSDVAIPGDLSQDDTVDLDVPVLIQGDAYFDANGTTHVHVANIAAPRISPRSLMVSDYPERLTENGVLFTSVLQHDAPSRFLYFHYNPPGQPDRRIVLRASNHSAEPAIVQFIAGLGGPSPNEMEAGHDATKRFLVHVVQNEGRLITVGAHQSFNILAQNLPAGQILSELLQLRVLSGGNIHLALFAQNASDDPNAPLAQTDLLTSTVRHARGIYDIPEFHYATQWDLTGPYLTLPIGQIPLPNTLKGEALAGDYGVLEAFVVNVQNPLPTPQSIAIYENPRGGHATGTYIIDGVLVQSHQVPPFSRYKVRQYVVPSKGFVRITIVTMPEGGSSYPLDLIFAPDDGSVAPGAPGSPIY